MIRRPSRPRRWLKWLGTAGCGFVVLLWVISAYGFAYYGREVPVRVGVLHGVFVVKAPERWDRAWWHFGHEGGWTPPSWLPRFELLPGGRVYQVFCPLWFPLAVLGIPTIWLWYADHRWRPPGHCRRCGYDLTGNVSGVCPECGASTPNIERRGR